AAGAGCWAARPSWARAAEVSRCPTSSRPRAIASRRRASRRLRARARALRHPRATAPPVANAPMTRAPSTNAASSSPPRGAARVRDGVKCTGTSPWFRRKNQPAAIVKAAATTAVSQYLMPARSPRGRQALDVLRARLLAARLAQEGLGQGDARRAPPESIEVVEGPHGDLEHVHHHVAVVDQDPLSALEAFDGERMDAERREVIAHPLRDRLHLGVRPAAADDEVVTNGGECGRLEDDQIVGLAVEGGTRALERPVPGRERHQTGGSPV